MARCDLMLILGEQYFIVSLLGSFKMKANKVQEADAVFLSQCLL